MGAQAVATCVSAGAQPCVLSVLRAGVRRALTGRAASTRSPWSSQRTTQPSHQRYACAEVLPVGCTKTLLGCQRSSVAGCTDPNRCWLALAVAGTHTHARSASSPPACSTQTSTPRAPSASAYSTRCADDRAVLVMAVACHGTEQQRERAEAAVSCGVARVCFVLCAVCCRMRAGSRPSL